MTTRSPMDKNAMAAFFDPETIAAATAAPVAGNVQLNDGNYVFQLISAVFGPKPNKPGVMQIVWKWLICSGEHAGQHYTEYDQYEKGQWFEMRVGFFKARILAFGYDPNDIVFGPNLNDALSQISAEKPAVNVLLVTSESTKTNAATGVATTYKNQNLRVQGAATLVDSAPFEAQKPAEPTPPATVAKRSAGRPAKAEAATIATPPAPKEPEVVIPDGQEPVIDETGKQAVSGGVPVFQDDYGIVFLPNMRVSWDKKTRSGEQRFNGVLIEAPEDESLPFLCQREGTTIQDPVDNLNAAKFAIIFDAA